MGWIVWGGGFLCSCSSQQNSELSCKAKYMTLLWVMFSMFWFHTELSTCWFAGDREVMIQTSVVYIQLIVPDSFIVDNLIRCESCCDWLYLVFSNPIHAVQNAEGPHRRSAESIGNLGKGHNAQCYRLSAHSTVLIESTCQHVYIGRPLCSYLDCRCWWGFKGHLTQNNKRLTYFSAMILYGYLKDISMYPSILWFLNTFSKHCIESIHERVTRLLLCLECWCRDCMFGFIVMFALFRLTVFTITNRINHQYSDITSSSHHVRLRSIGKVLKGLDPLVKAMYRKLLELFH